MIRAILLATFWVTVFWVAAFWVTVASAAVPEPEGFKLDDYRGAVPDTVAGAAVVHAEQVQDLQRHGRIVLIDVLAAPRRPVGMLPNTPWVPTVHRNLPGSLWWPDIGRGAISPELDLRLRGRLAEVTAAHPGSLIVFYCKTDCWLSWNAAKRAAQYGVEAGWFPEGADGWEADGLRTQDATPEFLD